MIHGIFPAGRSNDNTFFLVKTKDAKLFNVLKSMEHFAGNDAQHTFSFVPLLISEGKYTELMNILVRAINEDGSIGEVLFIEPAEKFLENFNSISFFTYTGRIYND